jgi:AcrR family transcriptional regulator
MSKTEIPVDSKHRRQKRRRRTADSARREILDAAGRQLMNEGPDGLRLQAIAADLGISHSSILHHFGSRDGLLDALSIDAFQNLERDLKQSFATPPADDPATDFFDQISRILGERGHAQLLAWQLLSGRVPTETASDSTSESAWRADGVEEAGGEAPGLLDRLAQTVHALQIEQAQSQEGPTAEPPDLDATRRLVVWTACTVFGEAFAGDLMMHSAGLGRDPATRKDFRDSVAKAFEGQFFPSPGDDEEEASDEEA